MPIERLVKPFATFAKQASAGGIVLLACAIIALVWANSPLAEFYFRLWATPVEVRFGNLITIDKPLLLWINDGLMAVFFFLVGMEIKRELLVGELRSPRKAALSMAAAVGGMIVPALIYTALNWGTPEIRGWGVPMATDIAFALGALALLGARAPLALKVFLTALAIVDDLGAVLVIALFYTENLKTDMLLYSLLFWGGMLLMNRLGVRNALVYFLVGLGMWFFMLKSGVHATVAGVLGAFAIPVRSRIDPELFLIRVREYLNQFDQPTAERTIILSPEQQSAVEAIEREALRVQSPLQRLEHQLHYFVAFAVMPIFALANAGVEIGGEGGMNWTSRVIWGVALGLLLGKPLGITLFSWLAVKAGLAQLPQGITFTHIAGVGFLAGIGFTMALFIGGLAFTDVVLNYAKLGILAGSALAGVIGFTLLRLWTKPQPELE
ncbi:MAG: Na+/H+ antiporter NhaA [Armatimonadetes bacterium JP3_11]|nr:MAG: Na+/H+ antiporter NhaA [Armatimonadetes bacterium JP3_11]RMH07696.1 MAG: Na+/H+ antiporter NhaA [Armatimonadota bacterium]